MEKEIVICETFDGDLIPEFCGMLYDKQEAVKANTDDSTMFFLCRFVAQDGMQVISKGGFDYREPGIRPRDEDKPRIEPAEAGEVVSEDVEVIRLEAPDEDYEGASGETVADTGKPAGVPQRPGGSRRKRQDASTPAQDS
jgi:hypothetical protein